MGRTEKRRPTGGWVWLGRLLRDGAVVAFSIASAVFSALLALARHSQLVALTLAAVLLASGAAQLIRARHRGEDERYRGMQRRIVAEKGFGRLWIATGAVLGALALLVSPLLVAAAGAAAAAFLLLKGFGHSGRSGEVERRLRLAGTSAADECWRVKRWAEAAARAPFLPLARCFSELANYRVAPGQIGLLQTLILMALAVLFFAYTSLGLAIGISRLVHAHHDRIAHKHWRANRKPDSAQTSPRTPDDPGPTVPDPMPTYADSCPALPDPLSIGHGLGRLFQRDSAPKAGCGTRPIEVADTGAWVAAGMCSGEMRSLGVSASGYAPVILYGEPARFAWSAALHNTLVAAEAAEPAGGDVDLIETLGGTYAFARPSPSATPGGENIKWCTEASGEARPFARLAPPLALLWLELLRRRADWSWPVPDPSDEDNNLLAFLSYPSGIETADGACEDDSSCHLDVDGERWPGMRTAFVSLGELAQYMPRNE